MTILRFILLALALSLVSCAPKTISQLKDVKVDLEDEKIEGGLDKAIESYQAVLDKTSKPESTPDSIMRLADLLTQKEFDFSARAVVAEGIEPRLDQNGAAPEEEREREAQTDGAREAIRLYKMLLTGYPKYEHNDHVHYQLARIYEELGEIDDSRKMLDKIVKSYPRSRYIAEVQFRRGEDFYSRKQYAEAKEAYVAVVSFGPESPFYEIALYKLGWSYYKQDMYEAGLQQFVSQLDYKISTGYDLDRPRDSLDEKRIADTFRVMALCLSNLGGGNAVAVYFQKHGKRSYEVKVYENLGNYYLEKLLYSDAAETFKAFSDNNSLHKLSPYFVMRAIDSYRKGGFNKPVFDANRDFVIAFGLKSDYWNHFDISGYQEVTDYLKSSLKELATYYHAQYQDKLYEQYKSENFDEAVRWYREFLDSFAKEESARKVHYQYAELLLENKWYAQAAVEFERLAYEYPPHEKSASSGYLAVYALRKNLGIAPQEKAVSIKRDLIRISLKFVDVFPKNEKAALVMGAAVDDIYSLKDYALAAVTARKLVAKYAADDTIRRAAWMIFAHSSFEIGKFKDAEEGYLSALGLADGGGPSRAESHENLAATFYRQAERALELKNYNMAAQYFLFVGLYAPTAKIRPVADFDGATALMQLKEWDKAAAVFTTLRENFPQHKLQPEVTKKMAYIYKEAGKLSLAADEYDRIGTESGDMAIRREAWEVAMDLYAKAGEKDKAVPLYRRYVSNFQKPLEFVLEIRNKIATYMKEHNEMEGYFAELRIIKEADAQGGTERTDRTRYLGGEAALVLTEQTVNQLAEIKLVKPFDINLLKKKESMKSVKDQLEKLFDYEVDDVTSAATYYLAEIYYDFSRSLADSERPDDLNDLEKEQYELSIEEQSYPFEEKTIQVHQKNLELITSGIYNSWVDKSIEKLAKLMPARYAKFEESSGFIESVETVSYVALTDPKRKSTRVPPVVYQAVPANVPAQPNPGSGK